MKLHFGPIIFDGDLEHLLSGRALINLGQFAGSPTGVGNWPRTLTLSLQASFSAQEPTKEGYEEPLFCESGDGLLFLTPRSNTAVFGNQVKLEFFQGERWETRELLTELRLVLCGAALAVLLRENLGFIMHSSGTVHRGRGFLFPASSGSGKSTLARVLGYQSVLTDDLAVVARGEDGQSWVAGGVTPPAARGIPLEAVLFLCRGDRTRLGPELNPREGLLQLIRNTVLWNGSGDIYNHLMDMLGSLAEQVRLSTLEVNLSDLSPRRFEECIWPPTGWKTY